MSGRTQSAGSAGKPDNSKTPTGIEGFDTITGGGLPRGRTSLIVGGPGSGKTVFALQTLVHGAREHGEPGIFVTFEEDSRQIIANAASFGWDLPALEGKELYFVDAHVSPDIVTAGEFDLEGMLETLKAKAEEMGAGRVVFDSLDVLLTLLDDPAAQRREVYRVCEWLGRNDLTGIISVRVEEAHPLSSRQHSWFMQFLTDCLVVLRHTLRERVSLRTLRVVKYRGSRFAENEFPLSIGKNGVEVAGFGIEEVEWEATGERVSTGVERLDTMLHGGYFRGASVLISGAPGTAKSTLCGAFIEGACRRGERALFVSFDEGANEMVRNLTSVGVDLQPHIDAGLLRTYSARTEARSAEEHMILLRDLIEEHQPRCLVVDPLSAMLKAGGELTGISVARRLLHMAKQKGITMVCSSLLEGDRPEIESTSLQVSTVADTWIHLSYVVRQGERNRALTIIKSRGTSHSAQVRELTLSDQGVDLTDVYAAGGEVLMGVARWEKEAENERERQRVRDEIERKRQDLRMEQAGLNAELELIRQKVEARRAEYDMLAQEQDAYEREWKATRKELRQRREADAGNAEPVETS